ncbi:uncharacterized protein LOC119673291 [Teleopsis dalmanni]|uniref:uncharacterized protein LOC119673291 n=1 Tax=Teleopsis dalmanni TaxID=139649 RepID=UPI0018CDA82A|nr:uncharacterized protein LOC119673291 [Teleopsis dalmanni]
MTFQLIGHMPACNTLEDTLKEMLNVAFDQTEKVVQESSAKLIEEFKKSSNSKIRQLASSRTIFKARRFARYRPGDSFWALIRKHKHLKENETSIKDGRKPEKKFVCNKDEPIEVVREAATQNIVYINLIEDS